MNIKKVHHVYPLFVRHVHRQNKFDIKVQRFDLIILFYFIKKKRLDNERK